MAEENFLTISALPLKTLLEESDSFVVDTPYKTYRLLPSSIRAFLNIDALEEQLSGKADKTLSNVTSIAESSAAADKNSVAQANATAQSALEQAQQAASAVGNLQSIISQLQVEVSKMLGRMNFNAAVSTSVQSSKGVPSTFYSCPVDGYLFIPDSIGSSAKATVFVNNIAVSKKEASDDSNSNGVLTLMPLPVSAGDRVGIARSGTGLLNTSLIFVPQK